MKTVRLLVLLTAFLIMISSVLTLSLTTDRTPVYINVAAMACLAIIISMINLKNKPKDNI